MKAVNTPQASMKRRKSPWDNGFGLLYFYLPSGQLPAVSSAVTVRKRPLFATSANNS